MGGKDFIPYDEKKLAAFLPKKKKAKGGKDAAPEETKKSDSGAGKKANPKFDGFEKKLAKEQWLGGKEPTAADATAFNDLKTEGVPDSEQYPALFAWYSMMSVFSDEVINSWAK